MPWQHIRREHVSIRSCLSFVAVLAVGLTISDGSDAGSGPTCNWDEEAAIAKATRQILEEERDDVADPAPDGAIHPTTLTTNCGLRTELIDTLGKAVIRVPFANGTAINVYPILTTDKFDGKWRCNKVKALSACVTASRVAPEATYLTLKVDTTRNASEEILKVEPNGKVTGPIDSKYFSLLPKPRVDRYNRKVDDGANALAAAEKAPCRRACRSVRILEAEKSIITALRHHRLGALHVNDRRNDVRRFLNAHKDLTSGRKALHQAITLNEIGVADGQVPDNKFIYASPYELIDAVLWNSAPSYGAHQIDIGSNGGEDLGPFRASLARVVKAWAPNTLKALRDRTVGRKIVRPLETWGRTYPIALWGDFYRISDQLTADLRGNRGEAEYHALYDRFLSAGTGCMALLRSKGGVFANSNFAQLYVVDVANQKGAGTAARLAAYAQSLAPTHSPDQIEKLMVEHILSLKTGEDHERDVKRRSSNITKIAARFSDLSGSPASACNNLKLKDLPRV